jgi:hypothetical protein
VGPPNVPFAPYLQTDGANNAAGFPTDLALRDTPCVTAFVDDEDPDTVVIAHSIRIFRRHRDCGS